MFSRYARDLFAFRDFCKEEVKNVELLNKYILNSAHNKIMDYIFKYAGLISCIEKNAGGGIVCESGSSLYGLIDEAIACDYVYNEGKNIKGIETFTYLCSDIATMMNKGAEAFHSNIGFKATTEDTIAKVMGTVEHLSLFYGLSVSMRYALREADDIVKIANKSDLVILNRLSMIYGDTVKLTYGTGKYVYVISLPELVNILQNNNINAKFCTANMQYNKDGAHSVRASIVMSKDLKRVDSYVSNYEKCITMSDQIQGVEHGVWKDLRYLLDEK